MDRATHSSEEHELPSVEAVLAGTLALMTGYSQALQADLHPEQRVLMGAKIGRNLGLLVDHPLLSESFQRILAGLRQRWMLMTACTEDAGVAAGRARFTDRRCPADEGPGEAIFSAALLH